MVERDLNVEKAEGSVQAEGEKPLLVEEAKVVKSDHRLALSTCNPSLC